MEVLLRVSSAHSDAMLCEGGRWRTALKGSPGPGMAVTLVATASAMSSGTPTVTSAREVEMTGPDDPPCHQMRRRRSPRQPPLGASPVPWSPGKMVKSHAQKGHYGSSTRGFTSNEFAESSHRQWTATSTKRSMWSY
ncbi:histidine kinase [Anopheles sinensis]|uniref:Histidine kinase n=1 Tax=Anopheles sinensis TaxID=74873 RepID=A0A084VE50_ANOSI|nr:histidine kinase [Anopheles sinensis]